MKKLLPILGLSLAANSFAEIGGGIQVSVPPSDRLESSTGYTLSYRHKDYYVRATYENPDISLAGQSLGNIDLYGAEIGINYLFRPRLSVQLGVGHWWTEESTVPRIQFESVTTTLRNTHGEMPFHPTETRYFLGSDYGITAGLEYEVSNHFRFGVNYRWLTVSEGYDAYVAPFEFANNHWQDRVSLDLSSVVGRLEYVW